MDLQSVDVLASVLIFCGFFDLIAAEVKSRACLEGAPHLNAPSSAPLDGACRDWSGDACCSNDTSVILEKMGTPTGNATWLKFNWDHCGADRVLSDKCRRHFLRDLCFYECSPNVGPWLVPDKRKIRKSRFFEVPLCQRDCDSWYRDCEDDFTCTQNWNDDFSWENGTNKCPTDEDCKTFREIYGSPKAMCENIFGGSFKYAYDSQPCFALWFNGSSGNPNPNKRVGEWKANWQSSGTSPAATLWAMLIFFVPYFLM